MNSNIKDVYSLTPEQEGIYAQCFQGADNKTYHFQVLCKVNKDADLEIMKKSVELLSLRHQVLKTAFTVLKSTGAIKQVILENRMPAFSVLTQNEPFSQKILDRIIDEDLERSLDLQKDSLFRVTVVDFVDERFTLIHTHHIILDGWCFPVLIHDLQKYYGELLNGVSLEEITNEINKEISFQTSYAQYVNWIKSQDKDVALKYWQNLLKDCSFAHIFGKQKKNNTKNENIVTFRTHLNDGLSQNIDRFARKNKVSYNTIFECAFSIALQKFSNRNDVVFDKVVSGRSVPIKNIENTLGLFVNTVPVRIKSEENSTFENLIKEIQKQTINTNKYGIVPLAEVYKTCDIDGKSIDALFVFENYYLGELSEVAEEGPLSLKLIFFNEQTEFNLAVAIFKENNGYIVRTSYAKEMYTEREISRFIDGYISILDSSLAETKQIKDFSVLSHEEKEKVLTVFNDTAIDYPKDKCVHELFEEQAARTPDKTAVIFKETKLSYKELNLLVQSYADKLKHLGIHEGDVVAILLERSHKLIAFQLAVLKIGAIFLPLDKRYPEERIRYACSDCNVKLLISDETFNVKFDTTVLDIVDFDATEPQSKAETVNSNNECYIIYTSGSTGSPKGCLLTRRGLLNFCANNNTLATLKKQENCIFACVNSVSFDYFIAESLLPLTNGFSVVVFDDNESTIQKYFTDVAKKNNVNVLMTTPTRLKIYFDGKANADVLKQMCCICTSGEPLTADLLEAMYEKSPEAKVYNPIGPSECSVWDMGGELNREDGIDIHIGKPIANAQIYITDQYLNPVPIGVTGEICIAGDGVGAGYLNRPELTAEKFIDNPFGEGKLYRTGDLAYWREDGNIVFVGRNDFQVKIRGLRIELGEIEKAITAVDGVVSGVVVVRKDKTDRQLICAFYTGEEKSAEGLRAEIGKRLPKYMIPHIFMYLENMPMTTSGKINRNALPELDLENITTETEYVAPKTQEEKALADAISSILTKNAIGMFDNFFAIGGDSIKAIYIVSALEEKGYELRVADIMQSDTLADIAKSMKATSDKAIYNQSEVIGVIPFSPIMRAFLHERNTIPKDFVHFCIIATDCDEATARKAFDALISHHDMLRGSFVANGIEIHSSAENDIYSFKAISIEDTQKAKEYLNDVIIDDDKLVHVVFCETENENLIRIIVHHFLIDLVSWEVLMEDFKTAVNQIKNKEVISLPAKTASFMQWSEELRKYAEAIPEANKEYWKKINEALDHVSSFGANEANEAEKYSFAFDESFTDKLINAANKTYGTRTNEILLTALGQAACKIAGGDVGILVESHGRAELNKPLSVARTVGWFTACYPVVMNNNNNAADALIHTKETMRRIPKNGIEYLLLSQGLHKNTDILFNFYQNATAEQNRANELVAFGGGASVFPGKTGVDCSVADNKLSVHIAVPQGKHKKHISEELGEEFRKQIENIVGVCTQSDAVTKTRSDFSDDTLAESELDELKDLFGLQNIEEICSLSASQEGMYAQYYQSTDTKTYQLRNVCSINKEADLDMMRKSVELLARRHPVLKTAFTVLKSTGVIKQVILENRKPVFRVSEQGVPFSQDLLERIISENTKKSLDLQKDSLFRMTVIDFTDARFMMMQAHHIILDGWCLPILIQDVQKYYGALAQGSSADEAAQAINDEVAAQTSYAQYANWIKKQDKKEVTDYWKNLLTDCSFAHIFGKEAKDNTKNEEIVTFRTDLGDALSQRIREFAKRNKVSPNTVFECAFSIALQKYAGSDDVVFDKVISGRSIPLKNIENTVGPFINTVPVRIRSNENSTFADLLQQTQHQTIHANMYGLLPLAEVYKTCGIDSRAVDALFVFENYFTGDSADIENGPLEPKVVSFEEQTEFNLTVTIIKDNDGYVVRTSYAKEMYTQREIDSFVNGYLSVLDSALDATKSIRDIEILSAEEKQKVLVDFNDTAYECNIPQNATLYSLFEKTAEENAEKVCITADGKEITFKDFKEYTERIDSRVRSITEEKSVIAVICDRSFEMYGSVYGIIRGGNAYLPIDPNYPQDRIEYILENSQAKAVLAQDKYCHLAKGIPCIDATRVLAQEEQAKVAECRAEENDTAYVIYTSGSTGNPKGAKISHKSAINRILWMHDKYPLGKDDVILQKTPYTFDVSVWELFWWGLCGGCLAVSKPGEHFLPAKILAETYKNKVTHLHFVPSVFEIFLQYLETHKEEICKFDSVRYVFLSGEALTANLTQRFYTLFDYNKVSLHNLYGPTECAVDVTYYDCVPADIDPIPIGKPIYNTQMYVVDKYMNTVPIGVTGELCIGGTNVGQGYLNNPELTAEKFIDNPFGEGKLYRTGDLAYWREDGNIVFVGRNDFQVKIHGQRIELGEIESVITSYSAVQTVAVVVKTVSDRQLLVAYYCAEAECEESLRLLCEAGLPHYMVPSVFVRLDAIPLNTSGKADRKQLLQLPLHPTEFERKAQPAETEEERKICELFAAELGMPVGRNENFFTCGGTSLSMISLLSQPYFADVSAADFIANATPAKLALFMQNKQMPDFAILQLLPSAENAKNALVLFPYAGGDAASFARLVQSLASRTNDFDIYFVPFLHAENEFADAAEEIKLLANKKRIYFYSHCAGSCVAVRILHLLETEDTEIVAHWVAGGNIPPSKPSTRNTWRRMPKKAVLRTLEKAGAPFKGLTSEQTDAIYKRFLLDTDMAVGAFNCKQQKLRCPVSLVISKEDIFTRNYEEALALWKQYAQSVRYVHYIDAKTHYFQAEHSEETASILLSIFE